MNMELIIGTSGAFVILFTFLMIQSKKWNQDYILYDLLNLIGSILLVLYAYLGKSYPFLALNLIWGAVSFKDVAKYLLDLNKK